MTSEAPEMLHSLGRFLCLSEALSESFDRWAEETLGRDWSIEEGDLIRVLDLSQRQPQVVLEHHKAGHRFPDRLGIGLGGTQSQVSSAPQIPEGSENIIDKRIISSSSESSTMFAIQKNQVIFVITTLWEV
uniref:Uncharacterized protein n=1 Tax=Cyprinus carpio carpio TaxID=630221 RepID=A0A9J7ZRX8_CYPCA